MLADPITRYEWTFVVRRASFRRDEVFHMTDMAERATHASQLERLRRFFAASRIQQASMGGVC